MSVQMTGPFGRSCSIWSGPNVIEFQAIVKWPDRMDLWERFEEHYQNDGEPDALAFYTPTRPPWTPAPWSTGRPCSR